jgi:hypothetical protein
VLGPTFTREFVRVDVLCSILDYRFPELTHHYDNGEGGNCAIFDDWGKHRNFKLTGYVTRGLSCRYVTDDHAVRCFMENGVKCPDYVNPQFLTVADRQGLCQDHPDYYCTVTCTPGSQDLSWHGHPCDAQHCPEARIHDEDLTPEKGKEFEGAQKAVRVARVNVMLEVFGRL